MSQKIEDAMHDQSHVSQPALSTSDPIALDLIRYDSVNHPFVDRHGHLSLSFSGPATVGPQWLHPRSVLSTYDVVNPVLKLWTMSNDGRWEAARRTRLLSWPWAAEEEGIAGKLEVRSRYVFVDERTIAAEFVVSNRTAAPVTTSLAWAGAGVPDRRLYMLDYFDGASRVGRDLSVTVSDGPSNVVVALHAGEKCDLPNVAVTITAESRSLRPQVSGQPIWGVAGKSATRGSFFTFLTDALTVAPHASMPFQFSLSLSIGRDATAKSFSIVHDVNALIEQRRIKLQETIGHGDDWLVARARLGLQRCGLRGLGGEFGSDVASLCTADSSDFSSSFFWDSLFSSVALADFDRELSRGAIRTTFVRQMPRDGSTPERKWNHCVPQRMAQQSPQSPVATWALNQYLERHPDDHALVEELYPKLVKNYRFWTDYSDTDRDGLAEYRWTGQVSDNNPIWDFYGLTDGKPAGCQWVPPVASVALNSFLYRDAIELAALATRMGKADEAAAWRASAERTAAALNSICYVKAEGRYWDFNHHTQTHRRIRTFWMFWPLWAGVPMPAEIKRSLIEDVLLDEKQFFGPIPFPSVAYDEPTYNPTGYWRGKAWPHVSTWLVETLAREGFVAEAREAAKRLLATWSSLGAPTENLSTDPAAPSGGFADYNWGCAAVLLLNRFVAQSKP